MLLSAPGTPGELLGVRVGLVVVVEVLVFLGVSAYIFDRYFRSIHSIKSLETCSKLELMLESYDETKAKNNCINVQNSN